MPGDPREPEAEIQPAPPVEPMDVIPGIEALEPRPFLAALGAMCHLNHLHDIRPTRAADPFPRPGLIHVPAHELTQPKRADLLTQP